MSAVYCSGSGIQATIPNETRHSMAHHGASEDANAALEETLAAAYATGRSRGRSRFAADETTDRGIVDLGQRLSHESLEAARGLHAGSGLRVFFCLSFAPQLSWWYGELYACLRHTGVACAWASFNDPDLATKISVFSFACQYGSTTKQRDYRDTVLHRSIRHVTYLSHLCRPVEQRVERRRFNPELVPEVSRVMAVLLSGGCGGIVNRVSEQKETLQLFGRRIDL